MIDYSDQTGIFDPRAFGWPVHVIGLGGIGSALVLALAKLGITELHLWDDDEEVEEHNIPAQLIYRPSDIGRRKVDAVYDFLVRQQITDTCRVICHAERVTESTQLTGVVISCVDSMESRQAIWAAVKDPEVPLYLDGRMGGEEIQLLTILNPCDPDQQEWYAEEWLFDDDEAAKLPCAERTVIHPPTVLAGWIIAQITLFARQLPMRSNLRADLKTMQFAAE